MIWLTGYVFAGFQPSVEAASELAKMMRPLCGTSVRHISRHMKSKKHVWRTEDTKYAAAVLGLRKKRDNVNKRDVPSRDV